VDKFIALGTLEKRIDQMIEDKKTIANLVDTSENSPVLVRVQKENETIAGAAAYLMKAKKTTTSTKVILIQTNENGLFDTDIYDGMVILQAPSLQIAKCL